MGQSHSFCTNGEEDSKLNAFVDVEETEKGDTETTFTALKIYEAGTTKVVFVSTVNTITPCSTMDEESPSHSECEEGNKGIVFVAAEEAEKVDFWKASLKQTIADETNNAKVALIDDMTPFITLDKEETEGLSFIDDLEQIAIKKSAAAPAPKKSKDSNRKKKTSTQMMSKATPGKTPKKSTRSRKHKTPKKERTYAQVAVA